MHLCHSLSLFQLPSTTLDSCTISILAHLSHFCSIPVDHPDTMCVSYNSQEPRCRMSRLLTSSFRNNIVVCSEHIVSHVSCLIVQPTWKLHLSNYPIRTLASLNVLRCADFDLSLLFGYVYGQFVSFVLCSGVASDDTYVWHARSRL